MAPSQVKKAGDDKQQMNSSPCTLFIHYQEPLEPARTFNHHPKDAFFPRALELGVSKWIT